jgi:hypothetical protein
MEKKYWLKGGIVFASLAIIYIISMDFIYHPPVAGLHQLGCNIWYNEGQYSFSSYWQCWEEGWLFILFIWAAGGLLGFILGSIIGYVYGLIKNRRQVV